MTHMRDGEADMNDEGAEVVAFLLGAIAPGCLALFLVAAATSESSRDKDARIACQKAGFHGGTYSPEQGFICFNYVSQRLP